MKSKIAGIGKYVPENVVTNDKLSTLMDTSDEWITERTGIKERRYAKRYEETTTTMGAAAARIAIERAGIEAEDIDFIIFATLSSDYYFPGCGVLLQRELGITKTEIGALDIRNQCTGFVYGISVADQFIRSGMYKNILLVGAEMHSMGLNYSTKGRDISVIFGDGAGAVVLQATEEEGRGILTSKLHSDGTFAEKLALICPKASLFSRWQSKSFQKSSWRPWLMQINKQLISICSFRIKRICVSANLYKRNLDCPMIKFSIIYKSMGIPLLPVCRLHYVRLGNKVR